MTLSQKIVKADIIGAAASSLCFVHCAATPFLFIATACSATCCADAPVWWQAVDYLFIVISFAAIYYATKNSTKKWVHLALWSNWALLLFIILSDTFGAGLFPRWFVYTPALLIIGLHIYNLKYCQCTNPELHKKNIT